MAQATAVQDQKRTRELKKAFAIAKNSHGMSGEVFRDVVEKWGFPRLSQCSYQDLKRLNSHMKTWFNAKEEAGFATQDQLDYLQTLWEQKSTLKTKQSLCSYILKRQGISKPELLMTDECSKEIQALKRWN